MQKKLLIIGAGIIQIPLIEKAKEMGFFVITIDVNIKAPGNVFADLSLKIDTNDKTNILKTAQEHKIDGILTTSDYPVRAVAYVCKQLGLPGLNEKSAELCTNKYLLRNHLQNNNFLTPKYILITNDSETEKVDFLPSIVKPVDSSASRGVTKINTKQELQNAYQIAKKFSKQGHVIVEEFITGREFSIETLTQNKKTAIVALTEKTVKGAENKFFVEDRHVIPANLTKEQENEVKIYVEKVVGSIDLGDAPTHTEIKITEKGIYIIEIGPRLGGDFISSDLVPLATGVDMSKNLCLLSTNQKINTEHKYQKYSGIQFINSENYEAVTKFLQKKNQFIKKMKIDDFVAKPLESSFDRLGYFIVQTGSRQELERILNCKLVETQSL